MNISQNALSPISTETYQNSQDNLISNLIDAANIKPFVSLKYLTNPTKAVASGSAIITYVVSGETIYSDTTGKSGTLKKNEWSWMIAGSGIGYSLTPQTPDYLAVQVCIALSPALENSLPQSAYLASFATTQKNPVEVLIGWHGSSRGEFAYPSLINYFVVHLKAQQQWKFELPLNHQFSWAATVSGHVQTAEGKNLPNHAALLDQSSKKIVFLALTDSILVLGSSPDFGYDLVFQNNSVHTSPETLRKGLEGIAVAEKILKPI
jgi:redox-sensitive bicupin YhaK (pirin superfamily)